MKFLLISIICAFVACGRSDNSELDTVAYYNKDGKAWILSVKGNVLSIAPCEVASFKLIESEQDCQKIDNTRTIKMGLFGLADRILHTLPMLATKLKNTENYRSKEFADSLLRTSYYGEYLHTEFLRAFLPKYIKRTKEFTETIGDPSYQPAVEALRRADAEIVRTNKYIEDHEVAVDELRREVNDFISDLTSEKVDYLAQGDRYSGTIAFEFVKMVIAGYLKPLMAGEETLWFRHLTVGGKDYYIQTEELTLGQYAASSSNGLPDRANYFKAFAPVYSFMDVLFEDTPVFGESKMTSEDYYKQLPFLRGSRFEFDTDVLSGLNKNFVPLSQEMYTAAVDCYRQVDLKRLLPNQFWLKPQSRGLFLPSALAPRNPCGIAGLLGNAREYTVRPDGNAQLTFGDVTTDQSYLDSEGGGLFREGTDLPFYGVRLAFPAPSILPGDDYYGRYVYFDILERSPPQGTVQSPPQGTVQSPTETQDRPEPNYLPNKAEDKKLAFGATFDSEHKGQGVKVKNIYEGSPAADAKMFMTGTIIKSIGLKSSPQRFSPRDVDALIDLINRFRGQSVVFEAFDPHTKKDVSIDVVLGD